MNAANGRAFRLFDPLLHSIAAICWVTSNLKAVFPINFGPCAMQLLAFAILQMEFRKQCRNIKIGVHFKSKCAWSLCGKELLKKFNSLHFYMMGCILNFTSQ